MKPSSWQVGEQRAQVKTQAWGQPASSSSPLSFLPAGFSCLKSAACAGSGPARLCEGTSSICYVGKKTPTLSSETPKSLAFLLFLLALDHS